MQRCRANQNQTTATPFAMRAVTKVSRRDFGEKRLLSFLRWSLQTLHMPGDILACTLVNKALDEGRTLGDLFGTRSPDGYKLKISLLPDHTYRIEFGCHAGPEAGDGGEWEVVFTEEGDVKGGKLTSCWMS